MLSKLKNLFFATDSTKNVVFKNFLWLSVSQVGGRIIRATITIYAARALGATQYGVFSYALGLAGFFIFFKNIGVDFVMTRDIAKNPESREKIFSTGFWIEIGLLIVTAVLLLFVAPMFSKISAAIILLPAVAIMLIADDLRDFFVAFFRGVEKMEWEAIIVTLANVSVTALGFIALFYARTPLSLAIAYASASLFVTIVTAGIIFWRYGIQVITNFTRSLVSPILSAAWPIAAAGLPAIFLYNVDIVMLGWWRSASTVGIYAATQKLVGILIMLPQLIAASIFPVFSRLTKQTNSEKLKQLIESALRIIFAFSIPLIIGGVVLGAPLLARIFGAEYATGEYAFVILLLSIIFTFPMLIISNFIFAHNAQRKIVHYAFIAAGTNIVLNILLVPKFGMIGASIATLTSFGFYVGGMYRVARKIVHFAFFPNLIKIVTSALAMMIMAIILRVVGVGVLMNIAISAVFYLSLLFVLKEEAFIEAIDLFRK